ncbi:TetR/AcrR family transcriptional regulator [Streptomyces sp. NBC_01221]|uniref:TetR/AcrR family transcriptional regulator n=1 Tax=unclassified Streptomyces TaxID=2593676 RepID=UPI00224DDEB5|nr:MULTISPECIES: TetR/AcrR family transcriptional regulator [unclassified Streptomyces]MCX4786376.1 TetR/AcrR family transcriptional regulator [Streptomyces sp. NBC_01221]WSJ39051.1 TetR/AcrR family transcriptional regulator [Streptomyces sp. NBC_01321]WSP54806.1 TetR/AcrR family transcriptional regulator [Streptomyces sp. NBC_01241]WSU24515.1 TetR/AcrR family transcriptional regulator [Streptomyces sp. NBC_01108]
MTAAPDHHSAEITQRQRLTADERRAQIITAARGVFVKYGFAGARTRDIAAEADVNEALVYRHFRSKEELFEVAVVAPLEKTVARLVRVSGTPPPDFDETGNAMHERTRQYMRDLLQVMDEVAPLLGVMLFGDAGTAATYYRERVAPLLAEVQRVVALNVSSWRHRDFDAELVVQSAFGAAWFHATAARLSGRPIDHGAVADSITTLLLDGLRLPDEPRDR